MNACKASPSCSKFVSVIESNKYPCWIIILCYMASEYRIRVNHLKVIFYFPFWLLPTHVEHKTTISFFFVQFSLFAGGMEKQQGVTYMVIQKLVFFFIL